MSTEGLQSLEGLQVADAEHWADGPPHALFAQMRRECPVHWSPGFEEFPEEDGFWSVTRADDVHAVSRDWQTYSSEIGGMTALKNAIMPLELQQAMFIGMDPPKHDRLKALFQRGFTPKRIADHEDRIRDITRGVLDRLDGQERCDLVGDVAQPVVARVIGCTAPARRCGCGSGPPTWSPPTLPGSRPCSSSVSSVSPAMRPPG